MSRLGEQQAGMSGIADTGGSSSSANAAKSAAGADRPQAQRPPILNPRAVPVSGHDGHLPALAAELLQAPALRKRLASAADSAGRSTWLPEIPGDGRVFEGRSAAAAAVLVPLVQRDEGLHVLLTRRTEHLRDHAGQVSFPGGRSEPQDADAIATALRESWEEVGLATDQTEVIGQLPTYTTVTHFVVTPVVALVQTPLSLQLQQDEVAEVFEVPLAFLMNPAHHQRHRFVWDGGERQFLSMPWQGTGSAGEPREFFIWGATAAMLRNLYSLLRAGG